MSAVWPVLVAICAILVAGSASAHVILHKRDVRAAIGWVGLIWLVPFAGAGLYGLLGINRIQRRAAELRLHRSPAGTPLAIRGSAAQRPAPPLAAEDHHLAAIARLIDTTAGYPLTFGNAIDPLPGVAAYDAMIEAIAGSRRTVAMATYIFDNDRAGRLFADALEAAVGRGVLVRVLIDGVGARYSFPAMTGNLRARNIPVAEFLPTFVPVHMAYANLRNHRKILVIDGRTGFTGGMNVRRTHLLAADRRNGTADTHFRIEGPVVGQLMATFADDWAFCTGEQLPAPEWFPPLAATDEREAGTVTGGEVTGGDVTGGDVTGGEVTGGEVGRNELTGGGIAARGIAAGPDEDFERIRYAILAALSQAQRRIRIVSPYFVPEPILMTSLALAAMRGVEVEICVPRRNNLRLVQWASRAKVGQLLAAGCRVWQTPPPFDHSKLMTVDGTWSLIGSANWDQRSLRLNFEFNVECYDKSFAAQLDRLIDEKKAASRPLLLEQIETRSLAVKLRDGAAWLLSPYL